MPDVLAAAEYQLLDFGAGRKLERFGGRVVDRPSPAAEGVETTQPELWSTADARFERILGDQGRWLMAKSWPTDEPWTLDVDRVRLELKLTEFGHLGVFPEHAANWATIADRCDGRPLKVLNLFAYTGAATLAAAATGAEATHVDSSKSVVSWARRNAELSGLSKAPVRWIVEDVRRFAARELKRGRRYDAVVLDPPSYGHGPNREAWKIDEHLDELLRLCGKLTERRPRFMLLTCHTAGYEAEVLADRLRATLGRGPIAAGPLELIAADGRRLNCGASACWTNK